MTATPFLFLYEHFSFTPEILMNSDIICNWFNFVFLGFYIISIDPILQTKEYKPQNSTYYLALVLTGATTVYFIYLISLFGPTLIALDRIEGLEAFGRDVFDGAKLLAFLNILLVSLAVIVWRTKNFLWFLLLAFPASLDLLAKGRMIVWLALMFAYLNYITISKKTGFIVAIPVLLVLVSTVFFRFENFDWESGLEQIILILFSDPINNRFSTPLVYGDYYKNGELGEYLLRSFFNFLPGVISKIIFGFENREELSMSQIITDDYSSKIGGFSLAVNLPAEALYYGGTFFAVISPIIIGGITYLIYRLGIYKTFPGFIFLCFYISTLRGIMRGTFYDTFMPLVYLMFSYAIWMTVLEWGRLIFVKDKQIPTQ
jgi:hypothetical protein